MRACVSAVIVSTKWIIFQIDDLTANVVHVLETRILECVHGTSSIKLVSVPFYGLFLHLIKLHVQLCI